MPSYKMHIQVIVCFINTSGQKIKMRTDPPVMKKKHHKGGKDKEKGR